MCTMCLPYLGMFYLLGCWRWTPEPRNTRQALITEFYSTLDTYFSHTTNNTNRERKVCTDQDCQRRAATPEWPYLSEAAAWLHPRPSRPCRLCSPECRPKWGGTATLPLAAPQGPAPAQVRRGGHLQHQAASRALSKKKKRNKRKDINFVVQVLRASLLQPCLPRAILVLASPVPSV